MSLEIEHEFDLQVELSAPYELGEAPNGTRRIIPIIGGWARGRRINGTIANVGADWQTVTACHIAQLDARYAIECDDGAVIEVSSQGIRYASVEVAARIANGETVDPREYYMRSAIRLSSGHPAYQWVNHTLFVASGGKVGATVNLSVYRVA